VQEKVNPTKSRVWLMARAARVVELPCSRLPRVAKAQLVSAIAGRCRRSRASQSNEITTGPDHDNAEGIFEPQAIVRRTSYASARRARLAAGKSPPA
jgi:hypothetical protein